MHKEVLVPGLTTVVYIEPDRTNALLMQVLLGSRSNYTLHHASDGRSGLEFCRRVRPDLVITETRLPDATAYEVLRSMRNDSALESVPCIVLSGDAMPTHIEQALAAGFDGYWTKPIEVWQLMRNIDDIASASSSKFLRRKGTSLDSNSGQGRQLGIRPGAMLQECCLPT